MKFPFQYKYYVCVSSKAKECYEHLSCLAKCHYVNRCIRSTNDLVKGVQGTCKKVALLYQYTLPLFPFSVYLIVANTFWRYDDFIVPSPNFWKKFLSTLGLGSDSDERNIQFLNLGIQHHLDGMSDLFDRFISGNGAADKLTEHIVSVCKHVNDHCVMAIPQQEVFCCRQADVQKVCKMRLHCSTVVV